jgi:hypothetical protein
MITQDWHADDALLDRYAAGRADMALSASVEAHLIACPDCRGRIARFSDPAVLQRARSGLRDSVQQVRHPLPLRILRRYGLSEQDAVLLTHARLLRGPWTLATVAVIVFAVAASFPDAYLSQSLYLLFAPLVPVLGVSGAFAATDSLTGLTSATPYSKLRLCLLRTVAVVTASIPLIVLFGAIMPGIGWLAVAWLGPALGLTLTALAAMTWFRPVPVGTAVCLLWTIAVAALFPRHDVHVAIAASAQLAYLTIAVATALTLVIRSRFAHTPGGYA